MIMVGHHDERQQLDVPSLAKVSQAFDDDLSRNRIREHGSAFFDVFRDEVNLPG